MKYFNHVSLIVGLIVLFVVEPFVRNPLYTASVNIIWDMQLAHPEKSYWFYKFADFLSALPTPIAACSILVFNHCNLMRSFICFVNMFSSMYFIGLFKLIYRDPRPIFETTPNIMVISCEGGFGNPSGHSYTSILFCLTYYEVLIGSATYFQNRVKTRRAILAFAIFLAILISLSRLALGNHSINQIVFGFCLGFAHYFIVFKIILENQDINDHYFIKDLITKTRNLAYICLVYLVLACIAIAIYYTISNPSDIASMFISIKRKCPNVYRYKQLDIESFYSILVSLSSIGIFIGIFLEFHITMKESFDLWKYYNYDMRNQSSDLISDDESFNEKPSNDLRKIFRTREEDLNNEEFFETHSQKAEKELDAKMTIRNNIIKQNVTKFKRWNSTKFVISILRLLVLLIGIALIAIPIYFIPNKLYYIMTLVLRFWFPATLSLIYIFYFFKRLCHKINLTSIEQSNRQNFDI